MSVVIPSLRAAVAVPPWSKNTLWRRARAVPTLDLRFADNKSLTDAVTGASLVTFTRASSGTYVDSAGVIQTAVTDAPRFDHNPTTGESLGLLVEEQRTNLLVRSEEFDHASWGKANITVAANSTTAPDGLTTADTITDSVDGAAAAHTAITSSQSFTSGVDYTISVHAKAGTLGGTGFVFPSSVFTSNLAARFNLTTGAVGLADAGVTASIIPLPNGWYRCSATATATATASSTIQIRTATTTSSFYQGNGTGTIFLWGAQLEVGTFPTSYIPTTTAAVTRSADVASITGTAFSGWYRQDEGTMFADASVAYSAAISLFSLDDNTTNNRVQLRNSNLTADIRVVAAGSSQATLLASNTTTVNTRARHAAAYRVNDLAVVLNSGTVATQATALLPVATQATLTTAPGSAPTNGTIRRLTFWPQRLANITLQQITQ